MKPALFQLLLIASTIVIATGQTRSDQLCPDYSFWNSQACMPCSSNCKTCTSYLGTCSTSSDTKTCNQNQALNDKQTCVNCPSGCAECTLEGINGFKCQKCSTGYQEVEDICIEISPGRLTIEDLDRYELFSYHSLDTTVNPQDCQKLDDDTARCTECVSGAYIDEFGQCEKCPTNCAKCNARGTCQECDSGSSWNQVASGDGSGSGYGACTQGETCDGGDGCLTCQNKKECTKCQDEGYYLNTNSKSCTACSSGCKNCTDKGCTTCKTGYYLESGNCNLCNNNNTAASIICEVCNVGKNQKCDTCNSNYTNVNGNCQLCNQQIPGCQSCGVVNNVISCTTCQNTFYLSKDRTTNVGKCIACSTVSNPQNAYLCNKDDKVNSDNVTVTQCAVATSLTVNALTSANYFTIGSSGNVACVQNTNACYKMVDNTGKCSDCVTGYYLKSDTKVCTLCSITITNCITCTNDPLCSTCAPGYILSSDKKSCIACPAYCDTCALGTTANTAICTKCVDQYAATADKSKCNPCSAGCVECDSTGKCLKCSTGYRTDGTNCIACSVQFCADCASDAAKCTKCLPQMFLYTDPSNVQNCYVCPPGCLDCSSSNNQLGGQKCNSCIDGYFKQGDGCTFGVDYCAKYNEDGSCQQCQYGMRESGGRCFRCVGMVGGYVCGENAGTSSCFSQIYQNLLMTFIASMILILH